MEIVSGLARGTKLKSPSTDDVRPTSVRARKAFFDSLGDLSGVVFADLFAGSGAMGLEAASRGAQQVVFVDSARTSVKIIEQNCARISRAAVSTPFHVFCGSLPDFSRRLALCAPQPQVIFADPPYADSFTLLNAILLNPDFSAWAAHAALFWELPDIASSGLQAPPPSWRLETIRSLGPARFMILRRFCPEI